MDPRDFPAFPAYGLPTGEDHANGEPEPTRNFPGMTLRDYFAAQALPSILQAALEGRTSPNKGENNLQSSAKAAYLVADAMLEARKA